MKVLNTDKAPVPVGPFSQGLASGDFVFVSGQIPLNTATGKIPEAIDDQADQCISNIEAVLAEYGMTLRNVIKTMVFLTDINDFDKVNARYAERFGEPYPARSCYQVVALPKGCEIEIEAIAVKNSEAR